MMQIAFQYKNLLFSGGGGVGGDPIFEMLTSYM